VTGGSAFPKAMSESSAESQIIRRQSLRQPVRGNAFHRFTFQRPNQSPEGEASSSGGEANDLLFTPHRNGALCRRQESFLNVFLGAGNEIAAATQIELALDVFAVALNGFNAETEGMRDLRIAEP